MLVFFIIIVVSLRPGSFTSELQLKVNCRPKVNCGEKFGLVCQLTVCRAHPSKFYPSYSLSFYNSLSVTIHLYMIWALDDVGESRNMSLCFDERLNLTLLNFFWSQFIKTCFPKLSPFHLFFFFL